LASLSPGGRFASGIKKAENRKPGLGYAACLYENRGVSDEQSPEPSPQTELIPKWARFVIGSLLAVAFLLGTGLVVSSVLVWLGYLPDYTGPDGHPLGSADLASGAVAGATMVLASITGTLALFTWESVVVGQREIKDTEAALAAARATAKASSDQARIAEETLLAGWRPLLTEPLETRLSASDQELAWVDLIPYPAGGPYTVEIGFLNTGRGPAFVTKALFGIGSFAIPAVKMRPSIVPPGEPLAATFELDPAGTEKSLVDAFLDVGNTYDFKTSATYHDLGRQRAWQSTGRLGRRGVSMNAGMGGGATLEMVEVEITDVQLEPKK
jgi:hypothetical protein